MQISDLPSIIAVLSNICFNLKSSASKSYLVGNSKTLAHILPNIVPPIDRQYTIRFFATEPITFSVKGKFNQVPNFKGVPDEKEYFNYIIYKTHDFVNHIKSNTDVKIEQPFNTSLPKIFDNLIVTYIRNVGLL